MLRHEFLCRNGKGTPREGGKEKSEMQKDNISKAAQEAVNKYKNCL